MFVRWPRVAFSFSAMRTFEILFVMYSDAAMDEKWLSLMSYSKHYGDTGDTGVQLTNIE